MFIHLLKTNKPQKFPMLGKVLNWEGELMKLQLDDRNDSLAFGEEITCYYLEWTFTSKIIKSTQDFLYLLVLSSSSSKHTFEQFLKQNGKIHRREHPRVNTNIKAIMMDATLQESEKKQSHVQILVTIKDVSIDGLGFLFSDELHLEDSFEIKSLSLDIPFKAKIKIANRRKTKQGYEYGAKINYLSEKDYFTLKKYIFIHQLEDDMYETTK
jgi:hypothetical protein